MAYISVPGEWVDDVYEIQKEDDANDDIDNRPLEDLTNRVMYLKERIGIIEEVA